MTEFGRDAKSRSIQEEDELSICFGSWIVDVIHNYSF